MKNRKELEDIGKEWFKKAIDFIGDRKYIELKNHMELATVQHPIEYEIIACIGLLTEKDIDIDVIKSSLNPQTILEIRYIEGKLPFFEIDTLLLGKINIFKISDALINLKGTTIENHLKRQGLCHEKNFELALKFPRPVKIVTGNISVLSDMHTFLHTWIEDDESECVFDYTLNVGININTYKELYHCQKPDLVYTNTQFQKNELTYNDFVKSIHKLYD